MKNYLLADRYARSLSSAIENDADLDSIAATLHDIVTLFTDNRELHSVLANPAVAVDKRVAILNAILEREGTLPLLGKLLEALVRRGRVALLPDVAELFAQKSDLRHGRTGAHVISAVALSEAQSKNITASLEKYSGMHVRIEHTVDPEILGGIVAHIGGKVIDGSVRTRIERIKQSLLPEENLGG